MLEILIVEDVPAMRERLGDFFTSHLSGYRVRAVGDQAAALRELSLVPPDLLLLDLGIPSDSTSGRPRWEHGRDVLRWVRDHQPHLKVIVLTIESDYAHEILIEEKADDFFVKDSQGAWREDKLTERVEHFLGQIACRSPAMQPVRAELARWTERDRLILLHGESGVGKKYLASVLHRNSPQRNQRLEYVAGATLHIPHFLSQLTGPSEGPSGPGWLSQADLGTLVLTDLENLGAAEQKQLAGVLAGVEPGGLRYQVAGRAATQVGQVRLVLTAAASPAELALRGRLTPELRAVLDPMRGGLAQVLGLPPLRERREDLPEIAHVLRTRFAVAQRKAVPRFVPGCWPVLQAHDWPGNGAEFVRVIEVAVQRSDGETIRPEHLDVDLPARYRVTVCEDAAISTIHCSLREVCAFKDAERTELFLHTRPGTEGLEIVELLSCGEPVELRDLRLHKLLLLLLSQAGERVDLNRHRRELGLGPLEQVRRFVFELRRFLFDPATGHSSHFILGHGRGVYAWNRAARWAWVREEKGAEGDEG